MKPSQKSILNKAALVGLVVQAISLNTFAAGEPITSSSTATESTFLSQLKSKARIGYFGQFQGPSIGDASAYQPGAMSSKPADADTILLYNAISLGYQATDDLKVGAIPRFEYRMAGTPAAAMGTMKATSGSDLKTLNPRLFVERANVINKNNVNLKLGANAELPMDAEWTTKNLLVAPSVNFALNYDVPNTRFSLGIGGYFRAFFYGADVRNASGNLVGRDMRAYVNPSVSYKLSKKVSLTSGYEMDANHVRAKGSLTDWDNLGTDLQTGVAWDVTERFSINPYIQVYTGGKISADTSAIGMYLSGNFL